MKRKGILMGMLVAGLALSPAAPAGPFVELGLGYQNGCLQDWSEKEQKQGCSDNPLGLVAIGYRLEGFIFSLEHRSSLVEKDKGANAATLRYRWEWE